MSIALGTIRLASAIRAFSTSVGVATHIPLRRIGAVSTTVVRWDPSSLGVGVTAEWIERCRHKDLAHRAKGIIC